MEKDQILSVFCQRKRDICDTRTNMSRIVHPLKPAVRPLILKERLIPILRIGHAWTNRRLINEARCSGVHSETDKVVFFWLEMRVGENPASRGEKQCGVPEGTRRCFSPLEAGF